MASSSVPVLQMTPTAARDVFMSFSSEDKEIADRIVYSLEQRGVTCWIAHRNIPAGSSWPLSISAAIRACSCFLLVFSSNSDASEYVLQEVTLATSCEKPIIPFRIEEFEPNRLSLLLADRQWIEASTLPITGHLGILCDSVEYVLRQRTEDLCHHSREQSSGRLLQVKSSLSRRKGEGLRPEGLPHDQQHQLRLGLLEFLVRSRTLSLVAFLCCTPFILPVWRSLGRLSTVDELRMSGGEGEVFTVWLMALGTGLPTWWLSTVTPTLLLLSVAGRRHLVTSRIENINCLVAGARSAAGVLAFPISVGMLPGTVATISSGQDLAVWFLVQLSLTYSAIQSGGCGSGVITQPST